MLHDVGQVGRLAQMLPSALREPEVALTGGEETSVPRPRRSRRLLLRVAMASAAALCAMLVIVSGVRAAAPDEVPDSRPLAYPFPATLQNLNRNATYDIGGDLYRYAYRSKDLTFNFAPVNGGTSLNMPGLEGVKVVDDPMMQALQDAKIVGELVEMAKNLRTDLGHTVDEFVNAGHELTLTLNRALQQKDLENVKQIEEELNREFGKLSGVHRSIATVQEQMERYLGRGRTLLGRLADEAEKLVDNEALLKVLRLYEAQLQNETAAFEQEQASTQHFIDQSNQAMKEMKEKHREAVELLRKHTEVLQEVQDLQNPVGSFDELHTQLAAALPGIRELKQRAADSLALAEQKLVRVEALSAAFARLESMTKDAVREVNEIKVDLTNRLQAVDRKIKNCEISDTSQRATELLASIEENIRNSTDRVTEAYKQCKAELGAIKVLLDSSRRKNFQRVQAKMFDGTKVLRNAQKFVGDEQSERLAQLKKHLQAKLDSVQQLAAVVDNDFEDFTRIPEVVFEAQAALGALREFESGLLPAAMQLQDSQAVVIQELEELLNDSDSPQNRLQIGSLLSELRQSVEDIENFSKELSAVELQTSFREALAQLLPRPLEGAAGNLEDARVQEELVHKLNSKVSNEVEVFGHLLALTEQEANSLLNSAGPPAGSYPLEDPKVMKDVVKIRRQQIDALNRLLSSAAEVKAQSERAITAMQKEIGDARRMIASLKTCLEKPEVLALANATAKGEDFSQQLLLQASRLQEEADVLQKQAENTRRYVKEREGLVTRERKKVLEAGSSFLPHFIKLLKKTFEELVREEEQLLKILTNVERLANNAVEKRAGRSIAPPPTDGTVSDDERKAEHAMTAEEFLRLANEHNDKLQAKIRHLLTRLGTISDDIRYARALLGAFDLPPEEESIAPAVSGRRLTATSLLTADQVAQHSQELNALEQALQNEKQKLEEMTARGTRAVDGGRGETPTSNTESPNSGRKESGPSQGLLLGVGLGVGIPLAIAGIAACGYYGQRKRRRGGLSNVQSEERHSVSFDGMGSYSSHQQAMGPSHFESIRISSSEFGDPETAFSGLQPSEVAGIIALQALPTPESGEPDTSQLQYMVDEHHMVARHMSKDVKNDFQMEEFPPAVIRAHRGHPL